MYSFEVLCTVCEGTDLDVRFEVPPLSSAEKLCALVVQYRVCEGTDLYVRF